MPSLHPLTLAYPLPNSCLLTIPSANPTALPLLSILTVISDPHFAGTQNQSTLAPPALPANNATTNFSVLSSSLRFDITLTTPQHNPPPVYPTNSSIVNPPASSYTPFITSHLLSCIAPSFPTSHYPKNSNVAINVTILTPAQHSSVYPLPHILNSITHALLNSNYFMSTTLSSVSIALPCVGSGSTGIVLDPTYSDIADTTTVTMTLTKDGDIAQLHTHVNGQGFLSMAEIKKHVDKVRVKIGKILQENVREAVKVRLGL
jgi:hypothetical protein